MNKKKCMQHTFSKHTKHHAYTHTHEIDGDKQILSNYLILTSLRIWFYTRNAWFYQRTYHDFYFVCVEITETLLILFISFLANIKNKTLITFQHVLYAFHMQNCLTLMISATVTWNVTVAISKASVTKLLD